MDSTTTPIETASNNAVPVTKHSAARRQIRGSTLLLVGQLLAKGVNFGVQVLIVRYLSKSDYGALAYALSIESA